MAGLAAVVPGPSSGLRQGQHAAWSGLRLNSILSSCLHQRHNRGLWFLLAVLVGAWSLGSQLPGQAESLSATVLSIGDRDTLRLRSTAGVITVRLACIDAPESRQGPWGAAAGRELQALLPMGKAVELKAKATDRYGRNVAEVFSGGLNINQALVASGAAFVYWQYIAGCDRNTYSRLETEARQRRLGVWSTPGGITRPWDYRRRRRSGKGLANTPGLMSPSMSAGISTRLTCRQIGSYILGQELLRQGNSHLDGDGFGDACKGPRRSNRGALQPMVTAEGQTLHDRKNSA
jgi:endonuclease YncB( thermonuclease family)